MNNAMQFGAGLDETFENVIAMNCRSYYRFTKKVPQTVQISDEGRFKEHIGEKISVEIAGVNHTVEIIGGENSTITHTVGTV